MATRLTKAEGKQLPNGTILACDNPHGHYIGYLRWDDHLGGPLFDTFSIKDGLEDSWEIVNWKFYSLASETEFVLWKLEYA